MQPSSIFCSTKIFSPTGDAIYSQLRYGVCPLCCLAQVSWFRIKEFYQHYICTSVFYSYNNFISYVHRRVLLPSNFKSCFSTLQQHKNDEQLCTEAMQDSFKRTEKSFMLKQLVSQQGCLWFSGCQVLSLIWRLISATKCLLTQLTTPCGLLLKQWRLPNQQPAVQASYQGELTLKARDHLSESHV